MLSMKLGRGCRLMEATSVGNQEHGVLLAAQSKNQRRNRRDICFYFFFGSSLYACILYIITDMYIYIYIISRYVLFWRRLNVFSPHGHDPNNPWPPRRRMPSATNGRRPFSWSWPWSRPCWWSSSASTWLWPLRDPLGCREFWAVSENFFVWLGLFRWFFGANYLLCVFLHPDFGTKHRRMDASMTAMWCQVGHVNNLDFLRWIHTRWCELSLAN